MCEAELGFEVERNVNILDAILRLPPALLPVLAERRHNVADAVTLTRARISIVIILARVTLETLLCVVQMTDDTVFFRVVTTTC